MSNMKKMLVGVIAAAIAATCAVSASAAWKTTAYDTDKIINENGSYKAAVTYELYDDNGLTTGLVVKGQAAVAYGLEPYAKVTFSAPSFERAYPNKQYVRIYADGVDTRRVMYNGVNQELEYRWANYVWELAAPNKIYQQKQALINGVWYTDETYPEQFLGDVATVKAEYNNYYGFGFWRVANGKVVGYMPAKLQAYAPAVNANVYAYTLNNEGEKVNEVVFENALLPGAITDLTAYKGLAVDAAGQYVVDVRKAFNLVVSGPKFEMDGSVLAGNEFAKVCNAADYNVDYLANFNVAELVKYMTGYNKDGKEVYATATAEWVDAGFECAAPYNCYQILKVDGVLLDGSYVGALKLPYVFRYTGATANPVELITYDTPLVATTTLNFVTAEHFHVK